MTIAASVNIQRRPTGPLMPRHIADASRIVLRSVNVHGELGEVVFSDDRDGASSKRAWLDNAYAFPSNYWVQRANP